MIRRSLRIGIRLGTLAGLAFALFKIFQARQPLPDLPGDADPWAPAGPARQPEPAPDEPPLVQPTMLQTTSLRRPSSRADEPPFDMASTAPKLVPPPSAAPAPVRATMAEVEPDDDEIVILTTDDEVAIVTNPDSVVILPADATQSTTAEPATVEGAAKAPAGKAPAKKASAKKASVKKASVKKASARKAPAKKASVKKASARKAPAKKVAAKKAPAKKASAKKASVKKVADKGGPAAWVDPDGKVCPTTHPVKARLRSAIFHLPGMAAYARTTPDRCYRDEQAAVDDGMRKALR